MAHLLFCINSSYVDLLMVCLHSIRVHGGLGETDVHIIHRSLKADDEEKIRRLEDGKTRIHFIHFDESQLEGAPTTGRYPAEIYFRLFAPILLPEEIDRILYMDVDTVCINSLVELYNIDIENQYFAGCTHTRKLLKDFNAIRLGMVPDRTSNYINTGVMVMNLPLLRERFDRDEIFSFIRDKGRRLLLPDQDVIMALYGSRIRIVDTMRYNLSDRMLRLNNMRPSCTRFTFQDVAEKTSIIHYCGRYKPWKDYYRGSLGLFYKTAREELGRYLDGQVDRG